MKPTLHRSLTLWAGLLVIIFTCWAWWDSSSHASGFSWKQLGASSAGHGILISHIPYVNEHFQAGRDAMPSHPAHWPHEFFPSPFLVRARETTPLESNLVETSFREAMQNTADFVGHDSWSLYLPYWLILLFILITWTALLLWRARRRKKAPAPDHSHSEHHQ